MGELTNNPQSDNIFHTIALPLPSVRTGPGAQVTRKNYGGAGDAVHLGGFTEIDMQGISPNVWQTMVRFIGVRSVIDLGCGRGVSTTWFHHHGIQATCVEGSHDALERTLLSDPASQFVEHDFSRGAWWPAETVDAVWCVEFTEHVQRQHIKNYLPVFRKAAVVLVSHSTWGGWHHAEVHGDRWWKLKFAAAGLVFSEELTKLVRAKASEEKRSDRMAPNGQSYNAQHVWLTMLVFINPIVAGMPQHDHLFAEPGCFSGKTKGPNEWLENGAGTLCGEGVDGHVARLPAHYIPPILTPEQDAAWEKAVFGRLKVEHTL